MKNRPFAYRLEGHTPVPEDDVRRLQPVQERRVAETTLPDGTWISTVFLAIDHGWGDGQPILFETMVFANAGDGDELDQERYATWDEAEAGHAAMVANWQARAQEDGQCHR